MIKTTPQLVPGDVIDGQRIISLEEIDEGKTMITFEGGGCEIRNQTARFLVGGEVGLPSFVVIDQQPVLTEGGE